jgi:rhomboid protease GluP
MVLERQTTGSVVCPSCGKLVGVREAVCPYCGRPKPGFWGFSRTLQSLSQVIGFTPMIIGACVVFFLLTLAVDPSGIQMSGLLSLLQPSTESMFLFGASGAVPVFTYGRWWTVLSASWLHGGLLHILFNMLWVRQLAPVTAQLYGSSRMVLIYLVGGAAGFILSSLAGAYLGFLPPILSGARFTIGASAAIFGLLGALVFFGRRVGGSGLGQQAWTWALVLFVFGFMMPGVDNFAHLGGFLGGYGMAKWLDPRKPEKMDHTIAAVIGLVLSLAAVVLSVISGRAILGG